MKRMTKVLLAVLLCAALLAGCGAAALPSEHAAAGDAVMQENGWGVEAPQEPEQALDPDPLDRAMQPAPQPRKLIYNARLHLESKTFDQTRTQLLDAVTASGGYVERSSEEGNADTGSRWAEYTLRIPCQQYQSFLQAAQNTGSLVSKEESVQDVTRQYVDVQARLDSLWVQEQRLLELAQGAQSMEDLLTIEEHLSQVRYQIESYTADQRLLDDQVDHSTITVTLREVTVYTPVAHSFGSRMQDAFGSSWQRFVRGSQDFVIGLIYALPNLIVLAVVVAAVVLGVKKTAPRRAARKARKHRAKQTAEDGKKEP